MAPTPQRSSAASEAGVRLDPKRSEHPGKAVALLDTPLRKRFLILLSSASHVRLIAFTEAMSYEVSGEIAVTILGAIALYRLTATRAAASPARGRINTHE